MSILSEYEEIRKNMSEDRYHAIEKYLELHPELYLSDIYYNMEENNKFEEWYKGVK